MVRTLIAGLALAGSALTVAPDRADSQSFSSCFELCHGAAMYVYETYGLNAARVYFDGCMQHNDACN